MIKIISLFWMTVFMLSWVCFSTFSCFNHIPDLFALHESDVVCCCGQSSHSYFQTEMSASHLLSLALQVSGIHYCRLNRSQMGYWSVTVDAWRSERVARCAEQRGNCSWTHCWELIRGNPEQMNRMVRAWGAELRQSAASCGCESGCRHQLFPLCSPWFLN